MDQEPLQTDSSLKRSQRIKKPSNRQLLYETNFDEKLDSPKRKYKKKNKKKLEKLRIKAKNAKKLIISNSNIKIENNQNIFICLDENFQKPEKISLKKKLGFFLPILNSSSKTPFFS